MYTFFVCIAEFKRVKDLKKMNKNTTYKIEMIEQKHGIFISFFEIQFRKWKLVFHFDNLSMVSV